MRKRMRQISRRRAAFASLRADKYTEYRMAHTDMLQNRKRCHLQTKYWTVQSIYLGTVIDYSVLTVQKSFDEKAESV